MEFVFRTETRRGMLFQRRVRKMDGGRDDGKNGMRYEDETREEGWIFSKAQKDGRRNPIKKSQKHPVSRLGKNYTNGQ